MSSNEKWQWCGDVFFIGVYFIGVLVLIFGLFKGSAPLVLVGLGPIFGMSVSPFISSYIKERFGKGQLALIDFFVLPATILLPIIIYYFLKLSSPVWYWLLLSWVVMKVLGRLAKITEKRNHVGIALADRALDEEMKNNELIRAFVTKLKKNLADAFYTLAKAITVSLALLVFIQFFLNAGFASLEEQTVHHIKLVLSDMRNSLEQVISLYWLSVLLLFFLFLLGVLPLLRFPAYLSFIRVMLERTIVVLTILTSFTFFGGTALGIHESRWVAELMDNGELRKVVKKTTQLQKDIVAANMLELRIDRLTHHERMAITEIIRRIGNHPELMKKFAVKLSPTRIHFDSRKLPGEASRPRTSTDRVISVFRTRDTNDVTLRNVVDYKRVAPSFVTSLEEAKNAVANRIAGTLSTSNATGTDTLIDLFVNTMIETLTKTALAGIRPFNVRTPADGHRWAMYLNQIEPGNAKADSGWWLAQEPDRTKTFRGIDASIAYLVQSYELMRLTKTKISATAKRLHTLADTILDRQKNSREEAIEYEIARRKYLRTINLLDRKRVEDRIPPESTRFYFNSDIRIYINEVIMRWESAIRKTDTGVQSTVNREIESILAVLDAESSSDKRRLRDIIVTMERHGMNTEYEPKPMTAKQYLQRKEFERQQIEKQAKARLNEYLRRIRSQTGGKRGR